MGAFSELWWLLLFIPIIVVFYWAYNEKQGVHFEKRLHKYFEDQSETFIPASVQFVKSIQKICQIMQCSAHLKFVPNVFGNQFALQITDGMINTVPSDYDVLKDILTTESGSRSQRLMGRFGMRQEADMVDLGGYVNYVCNDSNRTIAFSSRNITDPFNNNVKSKVFETYREVLQKEFPNADIDSGKWR